ncbi:ABC transporter substrate-binding protein [Spelaeicoccus albus]|uniref:sn-glycerol 3-phosphate transport system substrate-binding protein n=1 Tax=Spelaeicoccus albus TaxID=1280376 RepID=A0A7Z0D2W3_9MICO|nr:ABC transporter substrate-binding protein [Spelaeicoccus albus]NYI67875.1 sn-glycerol 3-phosphate transport system substrate-binding protein [Spelaeicoccus albus]
MSSLLLTRHEAQSSSIRRRQLLGGGALGLSAAALAACSGLSTSASGSTKSTGSKDYSGVKPAKKIEFWSNHPAANQAYEQKVVDKWNSQQSDTTVKLVTAGSDYASVAQKFQTAQVGGGLPGVVIVNTWFKYYLNGSIIPIDALVKSENIDKDDYNDTLWDDYSYDNQQWGVPYARSTPLFYYNKSHWKKAGLPDRAPKTWMEFEEWTKKLKSADLGTKKQFVYAGDYIAWTFENKVWGWGGAYSKKFDLTLDTDGAVKATDWARKGVFEGKWANVTASSSSTDHLSAEACSATVSSTGGLIGVVEAAKGKFDVGVGFLPGGPEATDNVCPTGGAGLAIPKDISPEEQVAAARFIKFLTSPENTVGLAKATGYMPLRKSANTKKLIASNPLLDTAIKQLPHTRSQDWALAFIPSGLKVLNDGLIKVLSQNTDPKETLADAKDQLQHAFKKDVKPNL